jgi:hypothetical protein
MGRDWPDGFKVIIRKDDRGDTVETADPYDEGFSGFGGFQRQGWPHTSRFRIGGYRDPPYKPRFDGKRRSARRGEVRGRRHLLKRPEHAKGWTPPSERSGWRGIRGRLDRPVGHNRPRAVATPGRDWAEEQERLEWRLKQLDKSTDPGAGPSASYVRGVLREEKFPLLAQHTERRIQALPAIQAKRSLGSQALPRASGGRHKAFAERGETATRRRTPGRVRSRCCGAAGQSQSVRPRRLLRN